MKAKRDTVLREIGPLYKTESAPEPAMVRTQIYLTPDEHSFTQQEAARLGKPMAAMIRQWIDEKMEMPEDAWKNNPLLQAPPDVTDFEGHEDGAINHDHYVYGCPKKFVRKKGKWVAAPALNE